MKSSTSSIACLITVHRKISEAVVQSNVIDSGNAWIWNFGAASDYERKNIIEEAQGFVAKLTTYLRGMIGHLLDDAI